MVQGKHVVMALPLQIAPFPAAQRWRAIFEQTLDPIDVVGSPLALRQSHAMKVEKTLCPPPLLSLGISS